MSDEGKRVALDKIGAKSAQHVVVLSDDRGLFFPKEVGEHSVWDDLKEGLEGDEFGKDRQKDALEAFSQSEGFPGFRLKELTLAIGPKEFLKRVQIAAHDLGLDLTHKSRFVNFLQPLEAGLLPLPEQGLVFSEVDSDVVFKDVDYGDEDLVVAEYDKFAMPKGYRGKTIAELRESGGEYLREKSGSARILNSFLQHYHVPLSNKKMCLLVTRKSVCLIFLIIWRVYGISAQLSCPGLIKPRPASICE